MKRFNLQNLEKDHFDIIVIGGGITGVATARDAALRGLKVLLIEKEDLAAGTSSRSSKLIHGGLRYLESYQFKLVAESVRERELALKLAPHLTKIQPFLYMIYKDAPEKKWLLDLGLSFYDFASGNWGKHRHKMLSKKQVLERQPQFKAKGLSGAAMFYDVSTDDARITLDTAKNAAYHGAQFINHCEVIGLVYDDKKCNGVKVKDKLNQSESIVYGHYIINATGPWSDDILRFEEPNSHILRPTKGVHIILHRKDFPLKSAIFMRSPDDGRVVWPVPSLQDDRVFIGTTDTTYKGDLNNVYPEKKDIDYLLNVANHLMPKADLTRDHIIGSWAGLRPLIAPKNDVNNSKTPREHQIIQSPSGVFSIIGGKLTSNRIMAKHILDAVVKHDVGKHFANLKTYRAHKIPISGAQKDLGTAVKNNYKQTDLIDALVQKNISQELAKTWVERYGYNAFKIADIWFSCNEDQINLSIRGLTVAEMRYCIEQEMAYSLRDLLISRTSIFFWGQNTPKEKIENIATEMGKIIGWDDAEKAKQVKEYWQLIRKHSSAMTESNSQ